MAYRVEGLNPRAFESLFGMNDDELGSRGAVRVTADAPGCFPCRVTLEDAEPGEELMLLNHVSHDVPGPFRTAYAIFVRKNAAQAAIHEDCPPPILDRRTLGLRGFDRAGMLRNASLAMPGECDARIRMLFDKPEIETIHAHNAAFGCFLARIERN